MIELMVADNFKLLSDFKKLTFTVGLKPMFTFQGAAFDTVLVVGESTDLQDVAGLQHVISMTIQGDFQDGEPLPNVLFRVYKLKSYRSDQGGNCFPIVLNWCRLCHVLLFNASSEDDFHTPSPDMVS
nr:AIF_HP1_G0030600.mRNA.1.CDS.1 [Saccharomyces cerevisiae]